MKVALLEASHLHVPLYLDPLDANGIAALLQESAELYDAAVGRYLHEHTRLKSARQTG